MKKPFTKEERRQANEEIVKNTTEALKKIFKPTTWESIGGGHEKSDKDYHTVMETPSKPSTWILIDTPQKKSFLEDARDKGLIYDEYDIDIPRRKNKH